MLTSREADADRNLLAIGLFITRGDNSVLYIWDRRTAGVNDAGRGKRGTYT